MKILQRMNSFNEMAVEAAAVAVRWTTADLIFIVCDAVKKMLQQFQKNLLKIFALVACGDIDSLIEPPQPN